MRFIERKNSSVKLYFTLFKFIPEMLMVLTILFFFIFGIVDAQEGSDYIGYGLFHLQSKFVVWLCWFLIGILGGFIQNLILNILISPIVILVENSYKHRNAIDAIPIPQNAPVKALKKVQPESNSISIGGSNKTTPIATSAQPPKAETPNINLANNVTSKPVVDYKKSEIEQGKTWVCSCGAVNNSSIPFCRSCYKDKPK